MNIVVELQWSICKRTRRCQGRGRGVRFPDEEETISSQLFGPSFADLKWQKIRVFTWVRKSLVRMWSRTVKSRNDGNSLRAIELVVPSSQPSTSFYIQTKDGSKQVYGTPRFEKDDSKLIVQLTSSYDGGIASAKPSMVNVLQYLCDIMAKSPVEITMIIDLCAPDVPHEDCNPDRNVGYEPLVIHWIKNCGVEDGSMSMNGAQIFAMTVICVAFILCVATSFLRYKNGKRGAEIFPFGPQLETAFYFVWNFVSEFRYTWRTCELPTQDSELQKGISLAIGKTKSSNGEVTVRFDSKRSSYQSGSDVISSSGSYHGSGGTSSSNGLIKAI